MPRKSKTRNLIGTNLGQHIAFSVAAHLARSQLVPNPSANSDGRELLDIVGGALLNVAPLYIRGGNTLDSRELTPAEIEGAAVGEGATVIVLKDGRRLGSVTMKRGDLRQAIAILKAPVLLGCAFRQPTSKTINKGMLPLKHA